MDKPLISVIVPVYNVEKYLHRCINSLLGQTYPNLEIILVDDGSPDNCGKICDEYAKKSENIKVLHQKNQGLSAARNNGVKISSGEYIAFVDSDDFIPMNSISHLYAALKKDQASLAVGNVMFVFEGDTVDELQVNVGKLRTVCYNTEEALWRMCYGKGFGVSSWAKLYSRNLVVENPYPVGMLYEDLALTYKIVAKCERVVELKEIVYFYFQREDSIVHCSIQPKHLEDGMKAANEELEFMKMNHPAVVPAALYRRCQKIMQYIPGVLNRTKQNKEYFKYLKKELRPCLFAMIKDSNVSIQFKIRCISVCLGYTPTRILYKTVDRIKGRTPA